MPAPKGQELGLRKPYSLRVGIDIERFRGTNTHGDPGSIGRDQFQALENVSFDGTRWGSRDGLSKVNSASAMSGCVYGLWDDDDGPGFGGGAVRVYGSSATTGGPIYAYDSELTTPGQQFKSNPLETGIRPQAILDVHEEFTALRLGAVAEDESAEENLETRFFIGGSAGRVYEWVPTSLPEGRTLLDTATYPKHILTISGLASADDVLSLAWWEGVLYILTENGSDLEVYSFDGESVALEKAVTGVARGALGVWSGEILLGADALYVRSVTGTWSSLTWPAGTNTAVEDIVEYGANAYIGTSESSGGSFEPLPRIVIYDGSTVAVAHDVPFVSGDGFEARGNQGIVALAVFDGNLCFFYYLDASEAEIAWAFVGTYDGSTWTDAVKTFKGSASDEDAMTGLGMVVSKGTLVVMLNDNPDAGDSTRSLQAAPGTNIAGTWTTLDSETPNSTLAGQANNGGLTAA